MDDERKTERMVELLVMGCGTRKIAAALHSSRESVRAARAALEVGGRILPFKRRLIALFEEVIELGAVQYHAALDKDEVPPASIPVGVGIFYDKRALLLREPTSIAARTSAGSSSITADQWQTWVRTIPQAG